MSRLTYLVFVVFVVQFSRSVRRPEKAPGRFHSLRSVWNLDQNELEFSPPEASEGGVCCRSAVMHNSTFLSVRLAACSFYESELELALLARAHLRIGQRSDESVSLAETGAGLATFVSRVSRRGMSNGANLTGSVGLCGVWERADWANFNAPRMRIFHLLPAARLQGNRETRSLPDDAKANQSFPLNTMTSVNCLLQR